MKQPRVLLADDHQLLRDAFTRLLQPACHVVGAVGDGRALVEAALQLRPDVVVADISMPLLNGLDAARQIKRSAPEIRTIILTVSEDPDLAAEAMRSGVSGYLVKNSAASELVCAIDEAMQNRTYITPLVTNGLMNSLSHHAELKKSEVASARQREVLQLLAEGKTMKQVARILKITPRTVAFHKYGMMKQFGVKTSAELVRMAVRTGVV